MPASKSSVRGYTILCAVLDEMAWLPTSEDAVDSDVELHAAIKYAMAPPIGAPRRYLLNITSAGLKAGYVFETVHKSWGKSETPVLVGRGETKLWNPSVDQAWLDGMRERDPGRYAREILCEFADSVSPWVDGRFVDAACEGRTAEPLPPLSAQHYTAAIDAAFKHDAFVLCIGHVERVEDKSRFVVDLIRRWTPSAAEPLTSDSVVQQVAAECRRYRVTAVTGDQFAVVPLQAEFRRVDLTLKERPASAPSTLEASNATW
jgi:hypothetical protein